MKKRMKKKKTTKKKKKHEQLLAELVLELHSLRNDGVCSGSGRRVIIVLCLVVRL